jgi:hypothetical protein
MEGNSTHHSEKDLINWMVQVTSRNTKSIKLRSPKSCVQARCLLQHAGLKLLGGDGKEVLFDLLIRTDHSQNNQDSEWCMTDGNTYGYRIADQELLLAIQAMINTYKNTPCREDIITLNQYRMTRKTLEFLATRDQPLQCIKSTYQSVRERLKAQEERTGEIEIKLKGAQAIILDQKDIIVKQENEITDLKQDNGTLNRRITNIITQLANQGIIILDLPAAPTVNARAANEATANAQQENAAQAINAPAPVQPTHDARFFAAAQTDTAPPATDVSRQPTSDRK